MQNTSPTHKTCPRCNRHLALTQAFFRKRSDKRHLFRPYCLRCDRPPPHPRPPLIINGSKNCIMCKKWFPATHDNFGTNILKGIPYLRSYCRNCQTKRHSAWVEQNRDEVRAAAKRSYDKHRELRVAREVARDKRLRCDPVLGPLRRAQHNSWGAKRRENPEYREKLRAWDREYAKTESGSARYSRRRGRLAGAPGHYTRSDVRRIAAEQGFRCFWCSRDISLVLTADHLIPLSRGGSNFPSNIVASCGPCNSMKHDKLPHEFLEHLQVKSRHNVPSISSASEY